MSEEQPVVQLGTYTFFGINILGVSDIANSLIEVLRNQYGISILNLSKLLSYYKSLLRSTHPTVSKLYNANVGETVETVVDYSCMVLHLDETKVDIVSNLARQEVRLRIIQKNENFVHFTMAFKRVDGTWSEESGMGSFNLTI